MSSPELAPSFSLHYAGVERSAVFCGSGLLAQIGLLVRQQLAPPPRRVVVCSDDAVWACHEEAVSAALDAAGLDALQVCIPAGEEQKSLATVAGVYGRLAGQAVERGDALIALGGGVPGDLFGFVAATYLRGLRLVQVPTSVVAQVDSSIGGKVGVDLPEGKNLVGAFKHPELVVIDYQTLRTLPELEWVAGSAEVAKHGVIADAALFDALEAQATEWRRRAIDPAPVLRAAIAVKARIVQEDERETGLRMTLNYGHTLGHALEAAAGYRGIRHGEAVAWGMAMAARLAAGMGQSTPAFVARQDRLLGSLGLLGPLPALQAGEVYRRLFLDKKARGGRLRWILPLAEPGMVTIRDDAPEPLVRGLVEATVAGTLLDGIPSPP